MDTNFVLTTHTFFPFTFHGQHRRSSNGCSATFAQRSSPPSTASGELLRPRDLDLLSRSSGTGAPRNPCWLHRLFWCPATAWRSASRRIRTLTPSRPGHESRPLIHFSLLGGLSALSFSVSHACVIVLVVESRPSFSVHSVVVYTNGFHVPKSGIDVGAKLRPQAALKTIYYLSFTLCITRASSNTA